MSDRALSFEVMSLDDAEDERPRLDRFMAVEAEAMGLSRVRAQALIQEGAVRVDGQAVTQASRRLRPGERVEFVLPEPDEGPQAPKAMPELPLDLIYADEAILVVNKKVGMVVHPALGHQDDTLVNALLARFPDLGETFGGQRPGIVHRLDRDTSGVMVVARTQAAASKLKAAFKAREVEKRYLAILRGELSPPEGIVDAPIGRDPAQRKKMALRHDGRESQTRYRLLAQRQGYSLVEAWPRTGRTHQIRVHFDALGHPVAGDLIYGRKDSRIGRLALHAEQISFTHPESGKPVAYQAKLPDDLAEALRGLGLDPDALTSSVGEPPR
jgi:23S rRNA pseudouridine1911/1915/1917 synthase